MTRSAKTEMLSVIRKQLSVVKKQMEREIEYLGDLEKQERDARKILEDIEALNIKGRKTFSDSENFQTYERLLVSESVIDHGDTKPDLENLLDDLIQGLM